MEALVVCSEGSWLPVSWLMGDQSPDVKGSNETASDFFHSGYLVLLCRRWEVASLLPHGIMVLLFTFMLSLWLFCDLSSLSLLQPFKERS